MDSLLRENAKHRYNAASYFALFFYLGVQNCKCCIQNEKIQVSINTPHHVKNLKIILFTKSFLFLM